MYETFFAFKKRPFLASPTLDRYYPAEGMEKAYSIVSRAIERSEGPVAVMGGAGVGKTLLSLRIADAWRKNFEVILLSSSKFCTRKALLQSLLFELRMPYRELSEGELRLSLQDRLQLSMENPTQGLILIVDEAQSLNLKLLEELRMLTNLTHNGVSRVRLILVGTPRLDELLGHARMDSLNQRLAARCYLNAFSLDETTRYVRHKVELCGTPTSSVFTEDALRSIHRAADGIPRIIDQISDHALCAAFQQGRRPAGSDIVEAAWAELQQIPSPWMTDIKSNSDTTSIEFGQLDIEEEDDISEFETISLNAERDQETHRADFESLQQPTSEFHSVVRDQKTSTNADGMDEKFFGISTYLTSGSYDIDDFVSISELSTYVGDHTTPEFQSIHPESQADAISPAATHPIELPVIELAQDPFGSDFVEEYSIGAIYTAVESSLDHEVDLDFRTQSVSPALSHNAIPVEPMHDEIELEESTVENEIREMISSLNLESTSMDPSAALELDLGSPNDSNQPQGARADIPSIAPSHVLSFASLGHGNSQSLGDDRDLLIVEEDVASNDSYQITDAPRNSQSMPSSHTPYSYVQLFSKLRG